MSDDHSPRWQLLREAEIFLMGRVDPYTRPLVEERLKGAVRSRVPVLGFLNGGGRGEQRFEHHVPPNADVDIWSNEIRYHDKLVPQNGMRVSFPSERQWRDVKVDLRALVEFFNEHGFLPPSPTDAALTKRSNRTTHHSEMNEAFEALRAEGQEFKTLGDAHRAVLERCGVNSDPLPRGWGYKTFAKVVKQP